MNLELKNVGKINNACIELNGITLVAGENNTGKSTIGKMLFCVLHSFYKIDEQVREERTTAVHRLLYNFVQEKSPAVAVIGRKSLHTIAKKLIVQKEAYLSDKTLLINDLKESHKAFKQFQKDVSDQLADKICIYLKLKDDVIRETILKKRLEAEFAMRIGHLNNLTEKTTVRLMIKGDYIDFQIEQNERVYINHYLNLAKGIIYIDDPFVLDDLKQSLYFAFQKPYNHRSDLIDKIANEKAASSFTLVDELVAKKKLEKILSAMNEVCDGNLSSDGGHFIYRTDKLSGSLDMVNLSTGMKSFIILRQLLQNGNIDENGVIILDEPEIHLHPEWQLKFAECIVLIQKEFGVNILLTTHSPYFLNAIEVYSDKYGIEKKCNYYLLDEKDGQASVINATDHTEIIYEKLAKPLQELENLEYRNDTL